MHWEWIYGYHTLTTPPRYGTKGSNAVYADSNGYYRTNSAATGAAPVNVYGTLTTGLGNLNVGNNNGVYYVGAGTGASACYYTNLTKDETTSTTYPSGSDSYG